MTRFDTARRAHVVSALVEGASINATWPTTGAAKHTVLELLENIGCNRASDIRNGTLRVGALKPARRSTSRRAPLSAQSEGDNIRIVTFTQGGRLADMDEGNWLEDLWNSAPVAWALVLVGMAGALWLGSNPQPAGYAIAMLALTAGIMSVRKMGTPEKMCWVALLISFTLLEVRAIKKGDDDSRADRERQNLNFEGIVQDLKQSMTASKDQYDHTIDHVDTVLQTTKKVSDLAKYSLANLTGGTSTAYLAPQFFNDDMSVPLAVVNPCKFPLTGVTVVITDMTTFPAKIYPSIVVGTVASHVVRRIDMLLRPVPATVAPDIGVATFAIQIYAQNGTSVQLLQFRKGKRMVWDYQFKVTRQAPGLHSMIPEQAIPTSDIGGFKFSTGGWIEDRTDPKLP